MKDILVLQLDGAMQSWGTETLEDLRPTNSFPTLSAILGLLGACIGIDRKNVDRKASLAKSVDLAVMATFSEKCKVSRIIDFHTVMNATKVDGSVNKHAVLSQREYLCDASFLVAIEETASAEFSLSSIASAIKRPYFTPFLGRRSCPPCKPIFKEIVLGESLESALIQSTGQSGVIFSSKDLDGSTDSRTVRDIPKYDGSCRQFMSRKVYVKSKHIESKEDSNVP